MQVDMNQSLQSNHHQNSSPSYEEGEGEEKIIIHSLVLFVGWRTVLMVIGLQGLIHLALSVYGSTNAACDNRAEDTIAFIHYTL